MSETTAPQGDTALRMKSARGRWVVAATVLGSGMAALDATVVGIALPAIGRDFNAGVTTLQWVVDAYTLTLAGLLLLGGTLGDSYGRRKVFVIGVVWFAVASLLCGLAPTAGVLIAARALQGVGAGLIISCAPALVPRAVNRCGSRFQWAAVARRYLTAQRTSTICAGHGLAGASR